MLWRLGLNWLLDNRLDLDTPAITHPTPTEVDEFRSMPNYEEARKFDEVDHSISKTKFRDSYRRRLRPLVVRGLLDDWDAFADWRDPEYLRSQAGDITVPIWEFRPRSALSKCLEEAKPPGNIPVREITFDHFLSTVLETDYAARSALYTGDMSLPASLRADVSQLHNGPASFFPEDLHDQKIFLGTQTHASLHHHLGLDTILCQVEGRKEVIMFPPDNFHGFALYQNVKMNYFSPVNVADVDLDEYPLFEMARPYRVVLEPGDALYIPNPWWHTVMSLDDYVCGVGLWSLPNKFTFHSPQTRRNALRYFPRYQRLSRNDAVDFPPWHHLVTKACPSIKQAQVMTQDEFCETI